jgi:hypothetical protein
MRNTVEMGKNRIPVSGYKVNGEGNGHHLAFRIEGSSHGDYRVNYEKDRTAIGGNTYNTARAYQKTLEAFDTHGALHSSTFFHTQLISAHLHDELEQTFGAGQYFMPEGRPKDPLRHGWFVRPPDGGKEHIYLSHTPRYEPENYELPGTHTQGKSYMISSTGHHSQEWQRLIDAKNQDPTTQIILSPGRNYIPPDVEPELLSKTSLLAMNVKEASNFLQRANPQLFRYIHNEEGKARSSQDTAKLLAQAIGSMGPESVLVTNGGYSVALYEHAADTLTTVNPPSITDIKDLVRESLGHTLAEEEVSFIGCGDTLLGVFLAMQKLTASGQVSLSTQEQLQIAVNIARYHGWSLEPHIGYMAREEVEKIAAMSVTKMAA